MAKSIDELASYAKISVIMTAFHERGTPKPNATLWEQIKQLVVEGKKIVALILKNNSANSLANPVVDKLAINNSPATVGAAANAPVQTGSIPKP